MSSLDEVVVVGYGNQRKVSVVGAQSTMDVKDIKMPAAVCLLLFPDALPGWLPFSVAANPVTMNRISGSWFIFLARTEFQSPCAR